ncbi:MAG: DedA family protein [Muribaculaceae bacterium]|nr:DedA family protein [Muribaculaceae bacterium]
MITLAIFDAADFFQWFVENANYLFVFVFMAIESSFIPFPSEVVVPPAAYLACTKGDMNIVMVVVVATMGAIVGALINYYLAKWIGRPIVYRFANSKFGHACLIDESKVQTAEQYFDKHGAISTFIGRLIPAVRQLISIPAGLARMNIWVFVLFTGLGAMLWNIILAALGWWLETIVKLDQLFETVEKYNSYLTYAGLAIAVICVMVIVWNVMKHKK